VKDSDKCGSSSEYIRIERTPSAAQLVHIAKKAKKPRAKGLKKPLDYLG
jgi:hypothetical protein